MLWPDVNRMTVNSRLYDIPKGFNANDIAIVFTISPFTINEYVRPAALPKSSKFQISNGGKTMVSGFGRTQDRSMRKPYVAEKFKYTQISIRPPTYCQNLTDGFDGKRFLCGIGKEENQFAHRDACTNDSGGPLIAKVLNEKQEEKFTLVGIVSYGDGVGKSKPTRDVFKHCGSYGVYTKVSQYLNFIHDPVHNY